MVHARVRVFRRQSVRSRLDVLLVPTCRDTVIVAILLRDHRVVRLRRLVLCES